MFRLRDLRNLKKQHNLRDYEWLFIACLKGGIELVTAEGPEAALSKSVNRWLMAEDVEAALEVIPERTAALIRDVVVKDMTLAQAGAKWGITGERVRVPLVRDFRRLCADDQQARLTGAYRLREEGLCDDERCPPDDDSIDILDLSVRAYNCLYRAKICSYHDFVGWCEFRGCQSKEMLVDELRKIRNLTRKNAEEIYTKMQKCGWLNFLRD